MRGAVKGQVCLNDQCPLYGKKGEANVKRDGFIKKKRGKTQRYRCKTCRKGFCSSRGTPYHLQHSRNTFDQAADFPDGLPARGKSFCPRSSRG